MEYKVGTAEILNPGIYKQVGAVLSFGMGAVGIDAKCMRTGTGKLREHGNANMIRFDSIDGKERFDENHTIMGLQSVLYQQRVITSIVIDGITVPYVVSDSGPRRDEYLTQCMEDLQKNEANIENMMAILFYKGGIYLLNEEDLSNLYRGVYPAEAKSVEISKGDDLNYRKGFAHSDKNNVPLEYDLSGEEKGEEDDDKTLQEVLQELFPSHDRIEVFGSGSAYARRSGRPVRFSDLPSRILHDIGANAYFAGQTDVYTPAEQEMMREQGIPTFFGENPNHFVPKGFRS